MKILIRLLASPFILGLYAVFSLGRLIKAVYQFILYGGEAIIYSKDDTKKLADIYELLKNQNKQP